MNSVYKKNLDAINKRHYLDDENDIKYREAIQKGISTDPVMYDISLASDRHGQSVICLNKDGYEYALGSRIDSEKAARIYAKRYNDPEPFETYVLFGLGDGKIARNVLQSFYDNNLLIAIEPNMDVFIKAMSEFDLSDIIGNECFFVLYGDNNIYEKLQNILEGVINPGTVSPIRFLISPGYDVLYPDACQKCIKMADYVMDAIKINSNTLIKMTDEINLNTFKNLRYLVDGSDLYNIIKSFDEINLSGIPAILVGAGPSLDKNIDELKRAEGKAFILAVDSAAKALVDHNINYNAIITGDAEKEYSVFEDERTRSKVLIAEISSNYKIVENWKGRIFFNGAAMGYVIQNAILDKVLTHNIGEVETGGSISTNAFSVLMSLGFKTIVLVGQDLAFTDGKGHVQGFSDQETREDIEERGIEQIEGWDGSMLITDPQMRYYIRWFEKKIEAVKGDIEVIDATQGGAKILGALNMTLSEVIDTRCKGKCDFDTVLENVPYLFEDENKAKCLDYLGTLPDRLNVFKKKLKKYKAAYIKMAEFIDNNITSGTEFDKTYKIVKKANVIDHTQPLYQLVTNFCLRDVYKYKNIVMNKDMPMNQVLLASAKLMDDCNKAIDEIIKMIEQEWNYL